MRSTRHSSSRGEWESTESQPAGDGDAWLPALVPEQLPQHAEEQHLSQVLNATGHDSIEQPGGLISEVPEPAVDTSAAAAAAEESVVPHVSHANVADQETPEQSLGVAEVGSEVAVVATSSRYFLPPTATAPTLPVRYLYSTGYSHMPMIVKKK